MNRIVWQVLLLMLPVLTVRAQKGIDVLDWKASSTLSTYLLQEMHRQYAPRAAELASAMQSAAGAKIYQDSVRAQFRRVLGPLPARTRLRAQVTGQLPRLAFRIQKVVYESTPHHRVTANLYVPTGKGKRPAVLLFCGHENEAKATISYQKTALLFVNYGFVVLVIDPISQGERLQVTDVAGKPLARGGTTEHTLLNAGAALVGTSVAAEELWDNVRGLDYLLTRPEVDAARIGCLGNSGGATQAAYFMAFDERVKVAALCSYVASGERNLELTGPADGYVQLPGAGRARLDLADWPILFAPKPLLLLAGGYDFVDYFSMEATYTETRRAYAAFGQPEHAGLFSYDDGHGISQPKREAAVTWFRQWLCAEAQPVHEGVLATATESELRCTRTGQVNTSYANEETLAARHQAASSLLAAQHSLRAPEAVATALRQQLNLPVTAAPATVLVERKDTLRRRGLPFQPLILRREGEPPLPALLLLPEGASPPDNVVLWLSGAGKATLTDSLARLQAYRRQHTAVLLADLRGLGETTDPVAFNDPKYYNREYRVAALALHMGRPLLAQRVADVQTLLALLTADPGLHGLPITLVADGLVSVVALHAAVVFPQITHVTLPRMPLSYTEMLAHPIDRDVISSVLLGVLHLYDLPDLQRALGPRLSTSGK